MNRKIALAVVLSAFVLGRAVGDRRGGGLDALEGVRIRGEIGRAQRPSARPQERASTPSRSCHIGLLVVELMDVGRDRIPWRFCRK